MDKYKILGSLAVFLGLGQLGSCITPILVYPKLNEFYADFGVDPRSIFIKGILYYVVPLVGMAMVNLYLGLKNLSKLKEKEKYFKFGLVSVLVGFFLTALLMSIMIQTIIGPMYSIVGGI